MAEIVAKGGMETPGREDGIQRSLTKAKEYMSQNKGKLRWDYGIDIWTKVGSIDIKTKEGDISCLNDFIFLMNASGDGSNERKFFSELATREMEILGDSGREWNKWTVVDVMTIEDLGSKKDGQKMGTLMDRHKTEVKKALGDCYENIEEINDMVSVAFGKDMDWDSQEAIQKRTKILASGLNLDEKMTDDLTNSWLSLNFGEMLKDMGVNNIKDILRDTISKNLTCLQELKNEIGEEGINKLYTEYGITNFGRYPREVLVRQIEDDGENRPYGIWIGAYADWNGAFMSDNDRKHVKSISKNASDLGFGLKIVEARDKMSMVKRIVTLDRKFGKDNKISFVVVNGHGDADVVALGRNREDILATDDLKKESAGKMRKYYAEKVPFLFNSCSTGLGIGPEYSRFGNSYSMAPDKPGSTSWVVLRKDTKGDLFFDGHYFSSDTGGSETVIFKNGSDFKEGLREENEALYEEDYQKMLKSKETMKRVWSGRSNEYTSILLTILKREKLDPLKKKLTEEFGKGNTIELESGMGGSEDDSNRDFHRNLSMDLDGETNDMDWGTGFIEDVGRGCEMTYAQLGEKRTTSWPEIRVIKRGEDGKKKILARYKVDMSDLWPENLP